MGAFPVELGAAVRGLTEQHDAMVTDEVQQGIVSIILVGQRDDQIVEPLEHRVRTHGGDPAASAPSRCCTNQSLANDAA